MWLKDNDGIIHTDVEKVVMDSEVRNMATMIKYDGSAHDIKVSHIQEISQK